METADNGNNAQHTAHGDEISGSGSRHGTHRETHTKTETEGNEGKRRETEGTERRTERRGRRPVIVYCYCYYDYCYHCYCYHHDNRHWHRVEKDSRKSVERMDRLNLWTNILCITARPRAPCRELPEIASWTSYRASPSNCHQWSVSGAQAHKQRLEHSFVLLPIGALVHTELPRHTDY